MAKLIEVLPRATGELTYREPNFYFQYKDKFYYYDYIRNSLFVMNTDCSDKKLIASGKEMRHPSFYLVYKDEAYFYNIEAYHNGEDKVNRKVNLLTGEVISIDNDYNFIPVSFNNGIVTSLGNRNMNDSTTFRKYNLDTNSVDIENKYKHNADYTYIYDYSTGDYYAINKKQDENTVHFTLYKNDILLSNFTINNVNISQYGLRINYLYVDNNALFLSDGKSLYKYDFKTSSIKKTENTNIDYFDIFYSNNSDTVYLYNRMDCYIYVLEKEKGVLNKLFKVPNAIESKKNSTDETIFYKSSIYDTDSKIILPFNANNLRYKTEIDSSLGSVVIYDKKTKDIKNIDNVRRAFFDYENKLLYIYVKDKSTYNVKKISLT